MINKIKAQGTQGNTIDNRMIAYLGHGNHITNSPKLTMMYICPKGIQPRDMKNTDIYSRRCEKH